MANRRPSALNARRSRTVMLMARASSRECTACACGSSVPPAPGPMPRWGSVRPLPESRHLTREQRVVIGIIEQIVDWFGPAFAVAGYWILAAGVFADRSAFLGLIIPGDVVLALGGVFAAQGDLDLGWVMVVGALAGISGESAGFWLGRRYGARVLKRIPVAGRLAEGLDAAEDYFRRRGGTTVFIGRYVSVAGTF